MADGLYLIVTTNKTRLRNGNCPITDPITEMGVAHTVGLCYVHTQFLKVDAWHIWYGTHLSMDM